MDKTRVKFRQHLINIITNGHYSRTCCTEYGKIPSLNDPLDLLFHVFLLSSMVLAPLCSGGVAHSLQELCGYRTVGVDRDQPSHHGPSEARKRWAAPGLGLPLISIIFFTGKQATVSLGIPTCRNLFCLHPLLLAYSPLSPPLGCQPHGPRTAVISSRHTGCPLGCGFLHPLHLANCSLLLSGF